MKKTKRKRISRIRHEFPYIEFGTALFFIFALVISTGQVLRGSQEHIILIPIVLILLTGIYLATNWRNKSIIIEPNTIKIKRYLNRKSTSIDLKAVKGYDLKETYSRDGLTNHIRIITQEDKAIEFIRDVYSSEEYSRLLSSMKEAKIQFLGKKELQSKNKYLFAMITKIAIAIAMGLFFLIQIIKTIK